MSGTGEAGRRGIGLVVSSPSGAGKTTLSKCLAERDQGVSISVSVTTRPPRADETEGKDYWFVSEAEFERMSGEGELLESAEVFGYRYGTPRKKVEQWLDSGQDVVFDIDWQGARQLRQSLGSDVVQVFIMPPSMPALRDRLLRRAQDSEAEVRRRMERALDEMSHWNEYDYLLVNRDIEDAYQQLAGILEGERRARHRQLWVEDFLDHFAEGGE